MKTFEVSGKEYPLRELRKWQRALRSGKYKQTTYRLNDKNGFCCLGVGCKVLISKSDLNLDFEGFILGHIPKSQSFSPEWLKDISSDFYRKTGISLTGINDTWGLSEKTFPFIAEMVEFVYVDKIYAMNPEWDTHIMPDLNVIRNKLGVII